MGIKDKLVQILDSIHGRTTLDDEMILIVTLDLRYLRCDHCRFYDPPAFGHPGFCHNPELHFDRPEGCPPDFFCSLFKEKQ